MAIRERTLSNGKKVYSYTRRIKSSDGSIKQYTSESFDSKKDARNAETLFLLEKKGNPKKNFDIVAQSFFKELYTKRKESTAYSHENCYENNIKPYFQKYDIGKIETLDIKNWKKWLSEKKTPSGKELSIQYKKKTYIILNSIFKYAIKNFDLENNVVEIAGQFEGTNEEIKEEKMRYITYDEFKQFISVIDDILWNAFFNFLYYTGMRKGEIQALNWHDLDLSNGIIQVNKTLTTKCRELYKITSTKNNINRKIKMNKSLLEIMIKYKNEMMKFKDFKEDWFVFGNSRFLPEQTIARKKQFYFELSGVREITIHEFRHSCVSLLVNEYIKSSKEKNIKIDTAKFFLMMSDRMGHTIEVMTRTYLHFFPTMQDEIVDLLDNL